MNTEERIEFFKNQIKLEKEIIDTASKSVDGLKNDLVKELILTIVTDSGKHASMLKALITLNSGVTPFVKEEISEELSDNIRKHIELEAKAISTYKELLDQLKNEKEKLLVKAIYQDEIKHHSLLKKIYKTIIEAETLTENEMWDFLMEDATPNY